MSENNRILLVDDEMPILEGLVRQHHRLYSLTTACGSKAGARALKDDGPFAVVVADFNMPGMSGIEFLSMAAKIAPSTMRIMLTGQPELQVALDAVNKGNVFRFMSKPCDSTTFRNCVDAAIEQWQLRDIERDLLNQTLKGSVEVLTEVLSLAKPSVFGKATRVQGYVRHIVQVLELTDSWKYETAALLSQIGCISIPDDILECRATGDDLPIEHKEMLERHPDIGRDLLAKIPRLKQVSEIVLRQKSPAPSTNDRTVELGGRILKTALMFDSLLSMGHTKRSALEILMKSAEKYGKSVIASLGKADVPVTEGLSQKISIGELMVGMEIHEDVCTGDGTLIVRSGHIITEGTLQLLRNFVELNRLGKVEFLAHTPAVVDKRARRLEAFRNSA